MWLVLRGQAHRHRVLRGGAFNNNHRNVRCAYRNRNNPNNWNRNIGFRVVVRTCSGADIAGRDRGSFLVEAKHGGVCSWPRSDAPEPGE